jgi:peptidyl-prolyl cis-trans isomerase SurA
MNDPACQPRHSPTAAQQRCQLLQDAYLEMLYNEAKIHNYLAEQIYKNGGQLACSWNCFASFSYLKYD